MVQTPKDPCSWVTSWCFKLAEYNFSVLCKAGKTIVNANAVLRNLVENIEKDENETNISESKDTNDSRNSLNFNEEANMKENYEMKIKPAKYTKSMAKKSTKSKKSTNPRIYKIY